MAALGRLQHGVQLMHQLSSCRPHCLLRMTASHQEHKSGRASSSAATKPSKTVRVGCASGFWGDTAVSAPQLITRGNIDFLIFDYLSEITMSLLTAARARDPSFGYAPDFVLAGVGPYIGEIKRRGIRVVSNAGGINPEACAAALRKAAEKHAVELKIAVVSGDDLSKHDLSAVRDMYSGDPLPGNVNSVNAYLGAAGIAAALDSGADIVVTGRCVDSALALGPLQHSFQWRWDDWDKLAAGSLAGHLLECGAQSTGGVFTDWDTVPDWHRIGFPVAECGAGGELLITKPAGTGGLVSIGTVAEQMVYEIGDPRSYLLPDVSCDFTSVTLSQEGDGVRVKGTQGRPPSDQYKVCATRLDGYRAMAVCPVVGPRAADKARKTAEAILARCRDIFKQLKMPDFSRVHIQCLGAEETYSSGGDKAGREAVLWLAVHHTEKKALELFSREVAPAGTGMAPGLCGIVGGRPKPSPVLRLASFLYPKKDVQIKVHVDGKEVSFSPPSIQYTEPGSSSPPQSEPPHPPAGPVTCRLERVALTRSGDKGDTCNIGVVARSPELYPHLCRELTAEAVATCFSRLLPPGVDHASLVERYTLPGIHALNFVLKDSLGGGGVASLRPDPQGKGYAQMLLDMEVSGMPELAEDK